MSVLNIVTKAVYLIKKNSKPNLLFLPATQVLRCLKRNKQIDGKKSSPRYSV